MCFVKLEFHSKIQKTTLQTCHKYLTFGKGGREELLITPLLFPRVFPSELLMVNKEPHDGREKRGILHRTLL